MKKIFNFLLLVLVDFILYVPSIIILLPLIGLYKLGRLTWKLFWEVPPDIDGF